MGERNGFVLVLVEPFSSNEKIMLSRSGAAADAAFRFQSLILHALVLGATRGYEQVGGPLCEEERK
jgi:hypothetical protein